MAYERLLIEAYKNDVDVYEKTMKTRNKGLYGDNVIWINDNIETSIEKACVLAEELGHHHTSSGDILDQACLGNKKQERLARSWAYKELIPLKKIIGAYKEGVKNKYELAEYLDVTEAFLIDALKRYKEEHGLYTNLGKYTIYFEPLGVLELFDNNK